MTVRPRSLDHRISELERRLDEMRAGAGAFSADAVNTYLRTGSLILSEEGSFQIQLSDGTTLMVLDDGRLRFNRADGTRQVEVTPASGLRVYAANGTTVLTTLDGDGVRVGTAPVLLTATGIDIASGKVKLNASGLEVDGGDTQAVWGFVDESRVANASVGSTAITSSATNIQQIVIDPPAWVQQLYVSATADSYIANSTGAPHRIDTRIIVDDGGASSDFSGMSQEKEATGITRAVSVTQNLSIPLSPAGRTVTVTQRTTLSSGSSTNNGFNLNVMVTGVRDAFV